MNLKQNQYIWLKRRHLRKWLSRKKYMVYSWKNPDWAVVLECLYDRQISVSVDNRLKERYDNPDTAKQADRLHKRAELNMHLSLPPSEIDESLDYLKSMEFIEKVAPAERERHIERNDGEEVTIRNKPTFGLSAKGFQLAHQRKTERSRWCTNVLLTLILISLSAIQYLPN